MNMNSDVKIGLGENGAIADSTIATTATDYTISSSDISTSPASSTYGGNSPEITSSSAALQDCCFPLDLDLVRAFRDRLNGETTTAFLEGEDLSSERLQAISMESREYLMDLTVSRTGRELQRYGYATEVDDDVRSALASTNSSDDSNCSGDPRGSPNCRLVTGCIPILQGGRILLISSTKSRDVFVLPKGGWEQDESLPVAALRETLEEAGVTGILGPPLPPLTYETKKSLKRRLSPKQSLSESTTDTIPVPTFAPQCTEEVTDQASASNHNVHTHNRLIIFPLYVQSIYEHWPEENRVRRSVSIEEAVALLEHRPEFLHMVEMLRERNLQHLPHVAATT
jgi:8-oxo-dGTP pyrophosphatase MutT (NUDIX family)